MRERERERERESETKRERQSKRERKRARENSLRTSLEERRSHKFSYLSPHTPENTYTTHTHTILTGQEARGTEILPLRT